MPSCPTDKNIFVQLTTGEMVCLDKLCRCYYEKFQKDKKVQLGSKWCSTTGGFAPGCDR
jgi:hypothetical protein